MIKLSSNLCILFRLSIYFLSKS